MLYLRAVRRVRTQGFRGLVGLWLACLIGGTLACGYVPVRYSEALGDARRIAIRGATNDTLEPGVDQMLTDALHREFRRRGALHVVSDPRSADLVLASHIRAIDVRGRSFSSIQFALEYQVRMALDVVLIRPDGTEIFLDPYALSETEFFLTSADIEVSRTNREEALRRLSSVLAGRVHDALYERTSP